MKKIIFPKLGMRIIKTALAVLITMIISDWLLILLLKDKSAFDSSVAVVVAIFTIQDNTRNTIKFVGERFLGTILGSVLGVLLLILLVEIPMDNITQQVLFYLFSGLGMILVLYVCKMIKMLPLAGLAAFIFLAVIYNYTHTPQYSSSYTRISPYMATIGRIVETAIGLIIALLVNRFIKPVKTPPTPTHSANTGVWSPTYPQTNQDLSTIVDNSTPVIITDTGITVVGITDNAILESQTTIQSTIDDPNQITIFEILNTPS